MTSYKSLPIEVLRAILECCAETGVLTWKARDGMAARNGKFAGKRAGSITMCNGKPYILISIDGKKYCAHRLVWEMSVGAIPPKMHIDHIDGNGLNNALANLRTATASENHRNIRRPANNKSGVIGVHWCSRRLHFVAQGHVSGKPVYLGQFSNIDDAAAARADWEASQGYHRNHGQDRPL